MKPYLKTMAVRKSDLSNCRDAASETVQEPWKEARGSVNISWDVNLQMSAIRKYVKMSEKCRKCRKWKFNPLWRVTDHILIISPGYTHLISPHLSI